MAGRTGEDSKDFLKGLISLTTRVSRDVFDRAYVCCTVIIFLIDIIPSCRYITITIVTLTWRSTALTTHLVAASI